MKSGGSEGGDDKYAKKRRVYCLLSLLLHVIVDARAALLLKHSHPHTDRSNKTQTKTNKEKEV